MKTGPRGNFRAEVGLTWVRRHGPGQGVPHMSGTRSCFRTRNKRARKGKNPNQRVKFRKRLCFDKKLLTNRIDAIRRDLKTYKYKAGSFTLVHKTDRSGDWFCRWPERAMRSPSTPPFRMIHLSLLRSCPVAISSLLHGTEVNRLCMIHLSLALICCRCFQAAASVPVQVNLSCGGRHAARCSHSNAFR